MKFFAKQIIGANGQKRYIAFVSSTQLVEELRHMFPYTEPCNIPSETQTFELCFGEGCTYTPIKVEYNDKECVIGMLSIPNIEELESEGELEKLYANALGMSNNANGGCKCDEDMVVEFSAKHNDVEFKSISLHKDFFEMADSLLLESDTKIAELAFAKGMCKYRVGIFVEGEVTIINRQNGEVYKHTWDYPEELCDQIESRKIDETKYNLSECNWYEVLIEKTNRELPFKDNAESESFVLEFEPKDFKDVADLKRYILDCIE